MMTTKRKMMKKTLGMKNKVVTKKKLVMKNRVVTMRKR